MKKKNIANFHFYHTVQGFPEEFRKTRIYLDQFKRYISFYLIKKCSIIMSHESYIDDETMTLDV